MCLFCLGSDRHREGADEAGGQEGPAIRAAEEGRGGHGNTRLRGQGARLNTGEKH